MTLSHALRSETAAAHEDAEESSFVQQLLAGEACRAAFVALAAQQLVIYRALEDTLWAHYADHPLLAPMLDHRLDRTAALEDDLTHLVGDDYDVRLASGELRITPAASAYATAIRSRHTAEMMLAHHYVRYLGDLSGGQIIARLVARHYDIDRAGLNFYHFAGIAKPKPFKDDYRARLDSLGVDAATQRRITDAAVESFEMNRAVFVDLDQVGTLVHAAPGGPGGTA